MRPEAEAHVRAEMVRAAKCIVLGYDLLAEAERMGSDEWVQVAREILTQQSRAFRMAELMLGALRPFAAFETLGPQMTAH